MPSFKRIVLRAARSLSGFRVVRRLTLRYYGDAIEDEHYVRLDTFMPESKFRKRMEFSSGGGYRVCPLVHFYHPSGQFEPHQLRWLEALVVETAATTRGGFNYERTPRVELRRLLDAETITDIGPEAGLCGSFELARPAGIRV